MNGFENRDDREFVLYKSFNIKIILRQLELLRLIKILEMVHSDCLANKFKRLLYIRDFNEKTRTEIDRKLPKGDINKYCMTPMEHDELVSNQRDMDTQMEAYYGKKI